MQQILVIAGLGIEALARALNLLNDDIPVGTGIDGDLLEGSTQGSLDNLHARSLISLQLSSNGIKSSCQLQQCGATPGNNALLNGGSGGIQGILDAQLAVFELGFGGRSHLDHGNATSEFGNAFGELFPVVLRLGVVEFTPNGGHTLSHCISAFLAGDDRGAFLADCDSAGAAEIGECDLLEGHRAVFANYCAAGEDGDVCQCSFTALTKRWSANSSDLQNATVFVHHQSGQSFPVHLFGQNHQGRTGLLNGFQHRHQVGHCTHLAVSEQQQCVVKFADLAVAVGDEIRGAVATVEGHAFSDIELSGQRFGFFDGDHSIDADLVHRFFDHLTHLVIAAGADRGHLTDGISADVLASLRETFDHVFNRRFHATSKFDWAGSGCRVSQTFLHHGLRQHGCCGGAISGFVFGLGRHLLDQFGANVFEGILELDLLRNRVAVINDVGCSE